MKNAVKLSLECMNVSELVHELSKNPILFAFDVKNTMGTPGNGVQLISEEAEGNGELEEIAILFTNGFLI